MCGSCASYDHSRNCGDECSDHDYAVDEPWNTRFADPGDTMLRCTRCGSCKLVEATDVAS
jgi:hypothetical protein